MSKTYPDYPNTNFPDSVDVMTKMHDADSTVITTLNSYRDAIANGNDTEAQAIIDANPNLLKDYIFNAEKYNKIVDAIMALQKHYVDFFKNAISAAMGELGIRSEKATGEGADTKNANSAYSITASEGIFEFKSTYRTFTLNHEKWKIQTANQLWYYDLEDSDSMTDKTSLSGTAYPHNDYDVEVVLSNTASIEQVKAWGKMMPSGYQTYNRIGTRVGIPSVDIPVLLKITPKK